MCFLRVLQISRTPNAGLIDCFLNYEQNPHKQFAKINHTCKLVTARFKFSAALMSVPFRWRQRVLGVGLPKKKLRLAVRSRHHYKAPFEKQQACRETGRGNIPSPHRGGRIIAQDSKS